MNLEEEAQALIQLDLPNVVVVLADREGLVQSASQSWLELAPTATFIADAVARPLWQSWPDGNCNITLMDDHGAPHGLVGSLRRSDQWSLLVAQAPVGDGETAASLARLAGEMDALHQAAVGQREELRQANADLRHMVYGITHDIAAPLRAMNFFVERLDDEPDALDHVRDGIRRIQALVDQLISYAKAGRASVRLKPVDLNELLGVIANDLRGDLKQAGAALQCDPLPVVQADPILMRQIFHNLIQNSIKFRGDAPLKINVHAEGQHIYVDDNGAGLVEGQAETMFELFERRGKQRGHGIGLALCRRLANRQGATISAEALDPGCRIILEFPPAAAPRATVPLKPAGV